MAEATSHSPRITSPILSNYTTVPSPASFIDTNFPFSFSSSDSESPRICTNSPATTQEPSPCLPVHEDEIKTHNESQLTHCGEPSTCIKVKPKNVVLFGECGVGKSSLINLMADCNVAATSSGLQACTLQKREYYFTLSSQRLLRVFDIVGIDASNSPAEIIRSLPNTEDIDLLLLCIRAGRFTTSMQ
ncbi:hypothetical protein V8E55_007525 [Tylopilus felleus]